MFHHTFFRCNLLQYQRIKIKKKKKISKQKQQIFLVKIIHVPIKCSEYISFLSAQMKNKIQKIFKNK